jgi:predicted esterase
MKKQMPSWFDIYSFDFPLTIPPPGAEDEAGILHSIASIDALLTEIVASGVDPSRIVLGGISQGAAMTILTGLTTARRLAGLIVLSARLPLRHKFKSVLLGQKHSYYFVNIICSRWYHPMHLPFLFSGAMGQQTAS